METSKELNEIKNDSVGTTQQTTSQNTTARDSQNGFKIFLAIFGVFAIIVSVVAVLNSVGVLSDITSSHSQSSYHGNSSIANSYAGVYTIKGVRGDTSDRWRFELNAKTMKATVDIGDTHYYVDWDVISSSKGVVINCGGYHTVFVISPQRVLYTMDTDTYNTTPLFNLIFQKY